MSLDRDQLARTAAEFRANWALAELDEATVERDLGMDADELHHIVTMDRGIDPSRAWLLRDYLDQGVRLRGRTPGPWVAMSEARRADAERWFGLETAPRPSI